MVKNAFIAGTVFCLGVLAAALRAEAQEVVYVLPVSPGGGTSANTAAAEAAPRFEGSAEYEADMRRGGLWRPRERRDLFARPGKARFNADPGKRMETGNEAGRRRNFTPERNFVRNAPVEGNLASSAPSSRMRNERLGPGANTRGRIGGQRARPGGLTQAYTSGRNSGAAVRPGTQNPDAFAVVEPGTGEREAEGEGGGLLRRPALDRPVSATSDAPQGDGADYGPPEDFGTTAQGVIDPLTGEVLPARVPVVTGNIGQPLPSASEATTSAAFDTAVGAAGTSTSLLVEGAITTIRDKPRPQWDPLGVRAGRFILRPSVDIETEFTDNVSLSASNKKSDMRVILRPSISIDSDFSRHGLSINMSGEAARHGRTKTENYVQFDASVLGRLDVRRNTIIDTELRYGISQEERNSTGALTGAARRPYVHTSHASIRATQRFNRLSVSLRGAIDHTDYKDTTLITGVVVSRDDRDYSDFTTTARLSYDVRPGMLVYAQAGYSARRHSQRFDNSGTARNSDGISGEAGATLALGRHMRADVALGYIHRDYDDPGLDNVSVFSANADLAWNVNALTTLRAGISTSVDETTIANASANVVREVLFGIDHELRRNFIIGAEFTLTDTKAIGSATRDVAYTLDLSADYRLNRKASLSANLIRRQQKSNRANADYTEHTATIGLNLKL